MPGVGKCHLVIVSIPQLQLDEPRLPIRLVAFRATASRHAASGNNNRLSTRRREVPLPVCRRHFPKVDPINLSIRPSRMVVRNLAEGKNEGKPMQTTAAAAE